MNVNLKNRKWLLQPIFGNKTRDSIREHTEFKNFPLFCQKCMQKTIFSVEQSNKTVINKPVAQPLTSEVNTHMVGGSYFRDINTTMFTHDSERKN